MKKEINIALLMCLAFLVSVLIFTACGDKDTPIDTTKEETTLNTQEIVPANGSIGLSYKVNDDKTTCTITDIGTCTDTAIYIPGMIDGYKVTTIDHLAFYRCSNLTSITIPDSVTIIGTEAFRDCSGLTSITIPHSVTDIYYGAFTGCSNLTSITIPNSITHLSSGVFQSCNNLVSVTIGNSVPFIGMYAFYGCSNLTSITLPDSVTSIELWAFRYCSNLTSITFNGTVEQWNAIGKGDEWDYDTGEYTIYCTNGTIPKEGERIG